MIKLGKLTDYAIVVMVQLAKEGASRSAHQLSEKTGLPEPTVAKVLKTLLKENLVSSARGAQGGYKLARAPEELSVRSIIEAIDGPIQIVACVDNTPQNCHAAGRCPTKGRWDPVNLAIRDALDNIRLSDMAADSQCGRSYDFIQPVLPAAAEG